MRRALVLGDSHAHAFEHVHVPGYRLDVCVVEGATASGVMNPNSKTAAHATFERKLRWTPWWRPVVFLLGEVDCGFVIFYGAERHDAGLSERVVHATGNYLAFLDRHPNRRRIVVSAPLPTILDDQDWGEVANLRREVTATLRQRTDMTLWFNALMLKGCRERGIAFVDATSPLMEPYGQVIRDEYRHPDSTDHHLHPELYPRLLGERVGPVIAGAAPDPVRAEWRPYTFSTN